MMRSTALSRALAAAGLTLAVLGVTAGPASAASAPLPYTCDVRVGDAEDTGAAVVTWDSAIPDGFTTPLLTPFSLYPFTGSIVLPDIFVEALRAEGDTSLGGSGRLVVSWDVDAVAIPITLVVPETPVPPTGPMTVEVSGVDSGPRTINVEELFSLIAEDFSVTSTDASRSISCATTSRVESELVIDTALGVYVPPSTATPTASSTPSSTTGTADPTTPSATAVRPLLVQTDAAPEGSSAGALLTVALVTGSGVLAALLVLGRRTAGRRH